MTAYHRLDPKKYPAEAVETAVLEAVAEESGIASYTLTQRVHERLDPNDYAAGRGPDPGDGFRNKVARVANAIAAEGRIIKVPGGTGYGNSPTYFTPAAFAAQQERLARERAAEEAIVARRDALIARAAERGFEVRRSGHDIQMSLDVFERLLGNG